MSGYRYILFDADNTLFNFSAGEYNSFKAMCTELHIPFSEGLYKSYSEINDGLWKRLEKKEVTVDFIKTERFRRLLILFLGAEDTHEIETTAERMRDIYMENLAEQRITVDGAEKLCAALYESGKYKLYITTNGVGRIQRSRFTKSSLYSYITELFVSEEIGAAKPSREYFDYVTGRIGESDRTKYLMVGDSLTSDGDGAIGYGIDFCFYNPKNITSGGRDVTYNINKLTELERILL